MAEYLGVKTEFGVRLEADYVFQRARGVIKDVYATRLQLIIIGIITLATRRLTKGHAVSVIAHTLRA